MKHAKPRADLQTTSRLQGSLKRRDFLRATLVSAGVLVGLSACGSEEADRDTGQVGPATFFPQSVASGDPRPNSVVLWTRVFDDQRADSALEVRLVLARDPEMREVYELGSEPFVTTTAEPAFDHCVKVRVDQLEPATEYYYRFGYVRDDGIVWSRVGRTKTAPDEDADVPVQFAVTSCQDYDAKYYHLYKVLAERDIDFLVHLGDYVYETAPAEPAGERHVRFRHPEQALSLGDGRLAARSLDNYRDLYRTYRSDPDLQRIHERCAFIAIWDDHEFSNDCHGATATYADGRSDEMDVERRTAADQAWFEYMPVDYSDPPARALDVGASFPNNLEIYRRFVFGRHLELVMTDLRRHRPDHVVPEDAFPGALFIEETEIAELDLPRPEQPPVAAIPIDDPEYAEYATYLKEHAERLGFRSDQITGFVSVPYLNGLISGVEGAPAPIELPAASSVRGYTYHQLLKTSGSSLAGARYLLARDPFRLLAAQRYLATGGASERMMGSDQRAWFLDVMKRSSRTFKVWGSSLCFMPRELDLRGVELLPEDLRARLLITAEDWEGAPNEREAYLRELAGVENVVILSGDLHCLFAGTPAEMAAPDNRIIEFVIGSVSSSTWLAEIRSIAEADPTIPPEVALAATGVATLLTDPVTRPNPHLAFQELERNGVTVVRVDGDALEAEFVMISPRTVQTPSVDGDTLAAGITRESFRVRAFSRELERHRNGRFWRWDPARAEWSAS